MTGRYGSEHSALLDTETRLRWDTGLERERIAKVRAEAGLEALS